MSSGLYRPEFEHDACGVSFVADLKGRRSHDTLALGIGALCNLDHRGATGADPDVGDGAGVLLQVPDKFLRAVVPFSLPPEGSYFTGIGFLPQDIAQAEAGRLAIEAIIEDEGLELLGWREVPVDPSVLGAAALETMPSIRQLFVGGRPGVTDMALERMAYIVRKRIEHEVRLEAGADEANEAMGGASEMHDGVYFTGLSTRTIVYKGMLTAPKVADFWDSFRT